MEAFFVWFWPEINRGRSAGWNGVESNTFPCQVVVMKENSRVWSEARGQFLIPKAAKRQSEHPEPLRTCSLCAAGARTYDHLKKTRAEERLKRTMLSEVLQYIQDSSACQQWLSRQADMYGDGETVFYTRRCSQPRQNALFRAVTTTAFPI